MIALNFRTKLLLAMMVLVVGVTATTLVITDNQVRVSYERHFQQAFSFQTESFLQQRESRLAPVKARVVEAAANPRMLAAMDNANQAGAGQQDVDDLYQNGSVQLIGEPKEFSSTRITSQAGFFFLFLAKQGAVLQPSTAVPLPFPLPNFGRIAQEVGEVGRAVIRDGAQQVGYLMPQDENGNERILEMVFTPIVDQATHQKLGVLVAGFPLPEMEHLESPLTNREPGSTGATEAGQKETGASADNTILSGIWLEGRLYSSSIPARYLPHLDREIGAKLQSSPQLANDVMVQISGVPHQVYCQVLKTGLAFPPARQICLYSLAGAEAEKHLFRRKILLSGTVALMGALLLSVFISRGMVVPLNELVAGATQIEHGNYQVKVPVRSPDEIGRLAEAFNDMTKQIEASRVAQEQRITERTQELAERKRAEEALRRSEASLREAQRIARLGNWQWNIVTNELRWSDEIYEIFGLKRDGFGATHEAFLKQVHPEDRDKVETATRQTLEAGKPYNFDHRIIRPDGEARIVHERAEVIKDGSGRVVQLVGTVQDITEQKRIEAEFLRAQRLDGIGALAGGMAHDLNNALAPILMGIQLIRRELKDPEMDQMLTVMEANTHRGADMVRQVLTFARGRDGDGELLDAGKLVREMENIVRQTLPKSIAIEAMVPADLWLVLGNSTQLHQVLLNLCVNARDAMPKGGELTLAADNVDVSAAEASEIPEATPGQYVMLLVSDTGTGIAPEVMPRIFDAFFTTKGPGKGTGLGLSTIVRIVRNHGGFVSVKSKLGEGTTFEIYLPRAEPVAAPVPSPSPGVVDSSPGRGELILFVDDDRSVREMVAPALADQGYRVLSAANGAEALALLNQHDRDVRLILTDLAMPVMDGMEMLTALRNRRPELPVILMSGTLDTTKNPMPPGVASLLLKPFRLEQLLTVIAQALKSPALSG
jgi:PAS domain S-box-containing protein